MTTKLTTNLGNPTGEPEVTATIEITGCPCRLEDFIMAYVQMSNAWIHEADIRVSKPKKEGCGGCPGA